MTRKQLRSLLEGFGVNPSFIIVRSEDDKATIRCIDKKIRNETCKLLEQHEFKIPQHLDDSINKYKYTQSIDFYIPEKYRPKKISSWSEILGEMENVCERPHSSINKYINVD